MPKRTPTVSGQGGYSMVELLVAVTITLIIMGAVYGLMIQNQQIYKTETNTADMQNNARLALDLITREVRMAGSDPSGRAFDGGEPPIVLATASQLHIQLDRSRDFWTGTTPNTPDGVLDVVDGYDCSSCSDPCDCTTKTTGQDAKFDCDNENEFGDGCINDPGEDVMYSIENGTLYRILEPGADEVKQPLAGNIQSLVFTYYQYTAGIGLEEMTLVGTPPAVADTSRIRMIKAMIIAETEDLVDTSTSPRQKKTFTVESDVYLRNRETI